MGRAKQTARKSPGGKAPRKQLATASSRSFRSYMTSQQSLGRAMVNTGSTASNRNHKKTKTSYINYDNTLGSFYFLKECPKETLNEFAPRFTCASTVNKRMSKTDHWLGISFRSKYDGDGIKTQQRPTISLAIVLDISGSMSCCFDEENELTSYTSKLDVAKGCIRAIFNQLLPCDSLAVILFDHSHQILLPLQEVRKINKKKFLKALEDVHCQGGTDLSGGFTAGTMIFKKTGKTSKKKGKEVIQNCRIMFLTDMESSLQDEDEVLEIAKKCADDNICFTSIFGIGVDLSVGTVQSLSSIPGAKYASCVHAEEFQKRISAEFVYDVTPIAFNITVKTVHTGVSFSKGYGSPELNNLAGKKEATFSSEFPSICTEDGVQGGLMLIKLDVDETSLKGTTTSLTKKSKGKGKLSNSLGIEVQWKARDGSFSREVHNLHFPLLHSNESNGCYFQDKDIRKAIALIQYVDLQSDYVLDDIFHESNGSKRQKMPVKRQREIHMNYVERFSSFISWFKGEMSLAEDDSIYSTNANVLQTLDQIVDLEKKEITALMSASQKPKANTKLKEGDLTGAPAEFLCPITHSIMTDPVVAADGHTYERKAIEQWIKNHGRDNAPSPLTMKRLPNETLTPNFCIRKMISDFKEQRKADGSSPKIDRLQSSSVNKTKGKEKTFHTTSTKTTPSKKGATAQKRPAKRKQTSSHQYSLRKRAKVTK